MINKPNFMQTHFSMTMIYHCFQMLNNITTLIVLTNLNILPESVIHLSR